MKHLFIPLLLGISFFIQGCSSIAKIVEDEFSPENPEDILKNTAAEYIVDRSIGGLPGLMLEAEMNLLKSRLQDSLSQEAIIRQPDEGILMVFNSDKIFKAGRDEINSSFEKTISTIANSLNNTPYVQLYILVHTDNNASEYVSLSLSGKRAKTIKKALVRRGIRRKHIYSEGKGALVPVISNETDEGKQLNRRVEMAIVADNAHIRQIRKIIRKSDKK